MSHHDFKSAKRPDPDQVLVDIADYVCSKELTSAEAYQTARHCLIDTLGCGMMALAYPALLLLTIVSIVHRLYQLKQEERIELI